MRFKGFAVEDNAGKILMNTIDGTERASKVNWLYACAQIFVSNTWTDKMIDDKFAEIALLHNATLVAVSIFPDRKGQVFDVAAEKREAIDKLSDSYIKDMWEKHGGWIDDDACMGSNKFYPFIRQLMKEAAGVA